MFLYEYDANAWTKAVNLFCTIAPYTVAHMAWVTASWGRESFLFRKESYSYTGWGYRAKSVRLAERQSGPSVEPDSGEEGRPVLLPGRLGHRPDLPELRGPAPERPSLAGHVGLGALGQQSGRGLPEPPRLVVIGDHSGGPHASTSASANPTTSCRSFSCVACRPGRRQPSSSLRPLGF